MCLCLWHHLISIVLLVPGSCCLLPTPAVRVQLWLVTVHHVASILCQHSTYRCSIGNDYWRADAQKRSQYPYVHSTCASLAIWHLHFLSDCALFISARILADEYTQSELRNKEVDEYASPKDRDKDEGQFAVDQSYILFSYTSTSIASLIN